jgi:hypothetical protein
MRTCRSPRTARIPVAIAVAFILGAAGSARAQEDDDEDEAPASDIEDQLMESVEETEEIEESVQPAQLPEIGRDVLEVFVLDRGFYVASDLGIFLTLGGQRGYSNVQPFLQLNVGFDIGDYFGIQLALSAAYASGNPVSQLDRPPGDAEGLQNLDATVNYGVFAAGLELVGAFRPTQRFAIEPKVGGGYSFVDPPLSSEEGGQPYYGKYDGSGGYFVLGADFKYLTLLTNFTAGASLDFYGYLGSYGFIPGLAVSAVVRYTL